MVDQVAGILGKLGLTARRPAASPTGRRSTTWCSSCSCPMPRPPHSAYLRTRPGDYGPQVRARAEVGHFIPAVDHLTALRARGTFLQAHARRDLQGHRHRHPADPGRSAADHRRARRQRRTEGAGGHGPRRQVHPAHQLPGPADARPCRSRAAAGCPTASSSSAGPSPRRSSSPSAKPTSARCRPRSPGRSRVDNFRPARRTPFERVKKSQPADCAWEDDAIQRFPSP